MTDSTDSYSYYFSPSADQQAFNTAMAGANGGGGVPGPYQASSGGGYNAGGLGGYTDKEIFQLQAALNEAAKTQQEALTKVTDRTDKTVSGNIDYFKQLTDQMANLMAPYQAMASQGSQFYLNAIGANGPAVQQATLPQANQIFKQNSIDASQFLQSVPGWSYNNAANQSSNLMNSMFGYSTPAPAQTNRTTTNQQPNMYYPPNTQGNFNQIQQQQGSATQQQANNPFNATAAFKTYTPPPAGPSQAQLDYNKQVEALKAKQAGYGQSVLDWGNNLKAQIAQNQDDLQFLKSVDASMHNSNTGGSIRDPNNINRLMSMGIYGGNTPQDLSTYITNIRKAIQDKEQQYKDLTVQLNKSDNTLNYNALSNGLSANNPYDAQLKALEAKDPSKPQPWTNPYEQQLADVNSQMEKFYGMDEKQKAIQLQLMNQPAQQAFEKYKQDIVEGKTTQDEAKYKQLYDAAHQYDKYTNPQVFNPDGSPNDTQATMQRLGMFNNANNPYSSQLAQVQQQYNLAQQSHAQQVAQQKQGQQGQLSQYLSPAQQAAATLQAPQLQAAPNQAMQALMQPFTAALNDKPETDPNKILNSLIDPATGAVNTWLNSGVVNNVMDATLKSGTNAVQNAAAARGMLDSGQTLSELEKVGVNAAGQYIVPYAGQLANNVLTQGAGLANTRMNNYYSLLGKGADFANSMMQTQAALTQGLAGQYNTMAGNTLNNLQTNASNQAIAGQYNTMQGLTNMMNQGQAAAGTTAQAYSNLAGNSATQQNYGNDIYGNAQLQSAGIEANRLGQYAQLQIALDRANQAQKNSNFAFALNGGGSLLGLGMMALGGGL